MLNELNDLAQKKSKAEKVVQEYNKKKEEEKIRKSVRSDKLEEFFEPVTKAVAAIPTTPAATPTVGQIIPLTNIMDQSIPAIPVPSITDTPEEPPDEPGPSGYSKQDAQITEIEPGGVNIRQFDAQQLENTDLSNKEKISKAKGMNMKLGQMNIKSEFPEDIEYLQKKNRKYYKTLQGKTGKGFSPGSYKIDANGSFSDLLLDLEQLFVRTRQKGQQAPRVVIDTSVDDDFIDLVTKRYNPKQKYSDSAKRMFKKLVTLSQHPLVKSSGKQKHFML